MTKKSMLNVKVIGCGGVGGCLLNVIPRYLAHLKDFTPNLTVVDGDSYTNENSERQEFTRLGNKAEVTAERLRKQHPSLLVSPVTKYITTINVALMVKEGDVAFCCVDNHATRKLLSDHCETLKNVVLISGGNAEFDGNIQVHIRKDGVDVTRPITYLHLDIQKPKDENPGERTPGCDALVQSAPQYLATNNLVAALMFKHLDFYLRGKFVEENLFDELYFADDGKSRTVKR